MSASLPPVFTALFILCSIVLVVAWQFALKAMARRRTRLLNLFGATTVCLVVGLVLAFVTRDHLFAPFMIVAGIVYMMGWALNVNVFAPEAAHRHGNEHFKDNQDARAPRLTIV